MADDGLWSRLDQAYRPPQGLWQGLDADQAAMQPETYANPLVRGLMDSLATLPRRAIENSQQSLNSGNYDPGPTLEAATLPMGTGAIAGVPVRAGEAVLGAGPIRAYHGSPHDFDAFDLSKIGTGEGAQAYGHGLYFAENEGTAKSYRDALAGSTLNPDRNARLNEIAKELRQYEIPGQFGKYNDPRGIELKKEYNSILDERAADKGKMYEVNINADPEHFLDWDKPLSEQQPHVLEAMHKAGFEVPKTADLSTLEKRAAEQGPDSWYAMQLNGLKSALQKRPGEFGLQDPRNVAPLRDVGIPGIKYLDQGSRASGDGSRNYVVFNDKLIDIMKKYGLAGLTPLASGLGLASQDDNR